MQDVDTNDILKNVFEPLVDYDEEGKLVGILAASWKISADQKTYTFTLKDASFHNGEKVGAEDVKHSFERALSTELASPTAETYLGDIVGAAEVIAGKSKELAGVKAIDEKTVEIKIDQPKPYFIGKLTYACADIVPRSTGNSEISDIKRAIGTGPFSLSAIKPEVEVLLKRNDTFHGEKPSIDGIQRRIVKDPATRLNLFRTGEVDLCGVEKQDWPLIQKDAELSKQFRKIDRPAIFYLLLSGKAYAPFKDTHVRRAVMMAIDRERITQTILQGVPLADRWIPKGITTHAPATKPLPFDPAAAKAELAKSPLKNLPELEISVRADNADGKNAVEQIANDLKTHLGMKVKLRTMELGAILKARNAGQLPALYWSWYADYLDPQNFLSILLTTNAAANYDKWSNVEFDKICAKADLEPKPAEREKLYLQAEALLLDQVPRVPLYFGVDGLLVSPRVTGVRYNLLGSMPHTKVKLK